MIACVEALMRSYIYSFLRKIIYYNTLSLGSHDALKVRHEKLVLG